MESSTIELPGSEIAAVTQDGDTISIHFQRVIIIKSMTGAFERTRWWQAGELVFDKARFVDEQPVFPAVCSGGDVGEGVYTYRNMIPVPLQSHAASHCDLAFEEKVVLYRVVQEALNNISKHAEADHVEIRVECDSTGVKLTVEDDGVGFDPASVPPDHLGLNIMKERAETIGAAFSVESEIDTGTRIQLTWNR